MASRIRWNLITCYTYSNTYYVGLSNVDLLAFQGPDFSDCFSEALVLVGHHTETSKGCGGEEEEETVRSFGENAAEDALANVICDDGFQAPVRVHHDGNGEEVIGGLRWEHQCDGNDTQHGDGKSSLGLP